MSWARLLEAAAARVTRQVGIHLGESFPYYHVAEYPKSGGTWLCQMLSSSLGVPYPQHLRFPPVSSAVIQTFRPSDPRLRRVCYLHRDGRDVLVSLYYDRIRIARHSRAPGRRLIHRTYQRLLGAGYDPRDISTHLPRFIEFELTTPGRGSPLNWPDHVSDWLGGEPHVHSLSYEQLLENTFEVLTPALRHLLDGVEPDPERVRAAIEKWSMPRLTGRQRGEEDPNHHVRKGVAGDWRNHFTRQAAEVFHHFAGDTLIRLGYEPNGDWVETVPALEDMSPPVQSP